MPLPDHVLTMIERVVDDKLSYLGPGALRNVARATVQLDRQSRDGAIIECGTALGGSAIVMAAANSPARPLKVYDLFGMIPPPTAEDGADVQDRYRTIVSGRSEGIRGDTYYGYRNDLRAEVAASFEHYGYPPDKNAIELIKGNFADTLDINFPVALAHLDGDWYESTKTCLERVVPHLVPKGRLIIDDYHFWQGCQKAVDEYFDGVEGFEFVRKQRLHIIKSP